MLIEFFQRAFAVDVAHRYGLGANAAFGRRSAHESIMFVPPTGVTFEGQAKADLIKWAGAHKRSEDESLQLERHWMRVAERRALGVIGVAFGAALGTFVFDLFRWG